MAIASDSAQSRGIFHSPDPAPPLHAGALPHSIRPPCTQVKTPQHPPPPHTPKRPPHLDGGRASCQQTCSYISWRTSTTNRVPRQSYHTSVHTLSTHRQKPFENPFYRKNDTLAPPRATFSPHRPPRSLLTVMNATPSVYPLSHPLTPSRPRQDLTGLATLPSHTADLPYTCPILPPALAKTCQVWSARHLATRQRVIHHL